MRWRTGLWVLTLTAAALPAFSSVSADMQVSVCESCHAALNERNSNPVTLWKRDIHRDAGLGCHDCHGGDPDSLETAMDPSRGFKGAPEGEASVLLCGGCHSDTERMPDPTASSDQMRLYLSGSHGTARGEGVPTCVTCHQSHGIYSVSDRSSPVFRTRIAQLCSRCHNRSSPDTDTGPWLYIGDVHGRALANGTNPGAPACSDCHGSHRADIPESSGIQMVCGNCHTREYEYFQAGPHAASFHRTGEPSCTRCHGSHGIEAAGIEEIIGRLTDNCAQCHQPGSRAWMLGRDIDENLGVAMSFLRALRTMSGELRLTGLETGRMDRFNQEAYGWLLQVESALHSVDTDWEQLTGMSKVKMMAAWDAARDHNLEKGIRKVIFLLIAILAATIAGLLAYKLKLLERDQRRRQILASPEARQREQERHRK